jgi:hypothetical protein
MWQAVRQGHVGVVLQLRPNARPVPRSADLRDRSWAAGRRAEHRHQFDGVAVSAMAPIKDKLLGQHIEDSVVSRTGFVQLLDRVCIELKMRGANDFVELRK